MLVYQIAIDCSWLALTSLLQVVDWTNGKAGKPRQILVFERRRLTQIVVAGEDESEILNLVRGSHPKDP